MKQSISKQMSEEYTFNNPDNKIITSGILSSLFFLLGLYVFGYYFTYRDTKFEDNVTGSGKNYSISMSLASGSEIGMLVFFSLGYLLLLALLYFRFNKYNKKWLAYFIPLTIIISTVFALLISMVIYSPFKSNTKYQASDAEHGGVAITAFTLALVFNLFINSLIIMNNRAYLPWLVILSLIQAGCFFGLFADAYYEYDHRYDDTNDSQTLFDSLENINYCFIIVSILLLTFFKTSLNY